jgi:hypothetical protein
MQGAPRWSGVKGTMQAGSSGRNWQVDPVSARSLQQAMPGMKDRRTICPFINI